MRQIIQKYGVSNFYCPKTGEQILSEDYIKPSPATLFHVLESNQELSDPSKEMEIRFNEILNDVEKGLYQDYKPEQSFWSDFNRAFDILIHGNHEGDNSVILFSFYDSTGSGGMESDVWHVAIDMSYEIENYNSHE